MDWVIFKLFFSFFLSFLFTYYITPFCIKIANTYNILDLPDGNIKTHKKPTPYLGGVAVYLGFIGVLALVFPFDNQFFLFLIGATILFYVGLIDDLIALEPLQKFMGQAIAVICFIKAGFYLKAHIFYHVWNIPISMFWMLLVINAFNLIDIMDGLAALTALCCTGNFLMLAFINGENLVLIILCAMLGALSAYFIFNKPSAKIYMGDAGSLFIGGILSSIPFLFSWGNFHPLGCILPVVVLAIPLLEVSFLIIIRTFKRIPFYKPSRDHFALYLKLKGYTEWQVLLFVLSASLILTIALFCFTKKLISFLQFLGFGSIFLALWIKTVFF